MTFAFCVIVCSILAFIMGFLACYLRIDKVREKTRKEFLSDVCDNDCEHCDWVTCPKAEEGAEE